MARVVLWVVAGQVHGVDSGAGEGLADLVGGAQASLMAVFGGRGELYLPGVELGE